MNRPMNEQDEFLLSRLLDNDLSPEESASLRERMEREPELRRAYAAMTRIDSLLAARQADQPQVNWSRFHSEVMSRVEAAASRPVTIRLAEYLRVALPLAAAAVIALTIWYWPHSGPATIVPPGRGPEIAVAVGPAVSVRYDHPDLAGRADEAVHVTFARSDELSRKYQVEDDESRDEQGSKAVKFYEPEAAHPSSPGLLAEALFLD